jgi:UDPglucose 6-dehydrogenase
VAAYDPVAGQTGVALLRGLVADGSAGTPGAADAVTRAESVEAAVRDADAVVVATEWPAFASLDWHVLAPLMAGDLVLDGRRIVDAAAAARAGLHVLALGVDVGGAVLRSVD